MSMTAQQRFGGPWTDIKLDTVAKYLGAWALVMKNQPFQKIYIDAFAGTGSRPVPDRGGELNLQDDVYDQQSAKGSARIALAVNPPFSQLYFIESVAKKLNELKASLITDFPHRAATMHFKQSDANEAIQQLCHDIDWSRSRAVLFLDPFGMQVDWQTVEIIAATKAIDLWYLVPTAIGIGRTATRDGDIPLKWQERLDRVLGTRQWRQEWYKKKVINDLFEGESSKIERTASLDAIEKFVIQRLSKSFSGGVAPKGLRLSGRGRPMYLLTFACANPSPNARRAALRIANHILKPESR